MLCCVVLCCVVLFCFVLFGMECNVLQVLFRALLSGGGCWWWWWLWKSDDVFLLCLVLWHVLVAVWCDSQTPLHYAARGGNTSAMEWLVASGAKLDAVDVSCWWELVVE